MQRDEKKGWEYIYISDEAMWKRERTVFTMDEVGSRRREEEDGMQIAILGA